MEALEESLHTRFIDRGATSAELSVILRVLRQLAEGLMELHADGIVHLDVKPRNALLDKDSNAKWTDFGFAQMRIVVSRTATGSASMRNTTDGVLTGALCSYRIGPFPWFYTMQEAHPRTWLQNFSVVPRCEPNVDRKGQLRLCAGYTLIAGCRVAIRLRMCTRLES
jgi:serine/threonine protein kinase